MQETRSGTPKRSQRPTHHPPTSEGGSSPQEDLDPELLAGSGGLVDRLNLSVKPESPLLRRLQIVVDHHAHPHLELVPPQQGSGAWSHVYGLHRHDAILRVTAREHQKGALCIITASRLYKTAAD